MRGFKNFKGSDARCPSIHFLFYAIDYALNNRALMFTIIQLLYTVEFLAVGASGIFQ